MPKPNLFIIGSMKSGTSYLHGLLGQHPQIFMSRPKEPSFFVADHIDNARYQRDLAEYLSLFSKAGDAQIIGESSTNYTKAPAIPPPARLIHDFCPTARLIYLMRDPVERAISHYWHAVSELGERRPPGIAFTDDDHYVNVSRYAMQLRPYLSTFNPGQILPIVFEELVADPRQLYERILRWLSADDGFVPLELAKPRHVTPSRIRPRRPPPRITDHRPSAIVRVASVIRRSVQRLRPIDRREVDMSESRAYLAARLDEDVRELQRLVNIRTDKWPNFQDSANAPAELTHTDADSYCNRDEQRLPRFS